MEGLVKKEKEIEMLWKHRARSEMMFERVSWYLGIYDHQIVIQLRFVGILLARARAVSLVMKILDAG
jgi:hypothetical protein